MNALKRRNHGLHRILAALLCLMLLFQHAGVYAEEPGMTGTAPAITEPAEEIAETPAGADDVPEENAGTPAEILPEGNGTEGAGNAGEAVTEAGTVQADPADAPAADVEPAEEEAQGAGEAGEGPEGNHPAPAGEPGTPDTEDAPPEEQAAAAEPTPIIDTSESITMFMPGFSLQPAYFEGTLVHNGPDYTVTAVIGKDAMLPADIAMRVAEVLPGTEMYEFYREMMAETLEEDEEMGEFARLFDIAFIAVIDGEETEIEPATDIDVQITFAETIAVTEEIDVQAVHFDENTPEVMDVSTDSLAAAADDDEAIDTLSFSSGSFSIYGFFQKVKKVIRVITASGEAFAIDVSFTSDSGIPDDAELTAAEITPDDPVYEAYRAQALDALEAGAAGKAFFFDIRISKDGEKIEPGGPVTVAITLDEMPEETAEVAVVHFGEEKTEVIEGVEVTGSDIQFQAESFSVYGVITEPGDNSLNGKIATIRQNGLYMDGTVVNGSDPQVIRGTWNANEAAEYCFVSTGESGKYYIYTTDPDTREMKYLNFSYKSGSMQAHALLSSSPQEFQVTQSGDNRYRISRPANNLNMYLDTKDGAFQARIPWSSENNPPDVELNFLQGAEQAGAKYVAVVKHDGAYYTVQADGSLVPCVYHEDTRLVEMESPVMWTYSGVNGGSNLKISEEALEFDGNQLPTRFSYRYINPNANDGITVEQTGQDGNYRYAISEAQNSALIYENHTLHGTGGNSGHYIGVTEEAGKLKLAGNKDAASASEVYLAVPMLPTSAYGRTNAVNHIDISVSGNANLNMAFAYGTYYDENGNEIIVDKDHPYSCEISNYPIAIKQEDMVRSEISAYKKNPDGTTTPMDDMFYVTGYSNNGANDGPTDSDQVRIEGFFKVSYTDVPGQNGNQESRAARLATPVYYTVTVPKSVTVPLTYNGKTVYAENPRTNPNARPVQATTTVMLSASFTYWDLNNTCPACRNNIGATWHEWRDGRERLTGDIPDGLDNDKYHSGSGMDFVLGDTGNTGTVAVEIVKYTVDEHGNPIQVVSEPKYTFDIYYSRDKDANYVQDYYGESSQAVLDSLDLGSYTKLHTRSTIVGPNGSGVLYDYDVGALVSDNTYAMMYVREDPQSIPQTIVDQDGETWEYTGRTRIETEYVTRQHSHPDHAVEGYTAFPEVLGRFHYLNQSHGHGAGQYKTSAFLEFHVYNEYTNNKAQVQISKYLVDENGNVINPMTPVENTFQLYRNDAAGQESVKDVNKGAYTAPYDTSAYTTEANLAKTITTTIGTSGWGMSYEDAISGRMYTIREDPDSIPDQIVDTQGYIWNYTGTEILTEYVWRADGDESQRHYSTTFTKGNGNYTAVPEILGTYRGNDGSENFNAFLDFFVYNKYVRSENKIESSTMDLRLNKQWNKNGDTTPLSSGSVTFRLHQVKTTATTQQQDPPEPGQTYTINLRYKNGNIVNSVDWNGSAPVHLSFRTNTTYEFHHLFFDHSENWNDNFSAQSDGSGNYSQDIAVDRSKADQNNVINIYLDVNAGSLASTPQLNTTNSGNTSSGSETTSTATTELDPMGSGFPRDITLTPTEWSALEENLLAQVVRGNTTTDYSYYLEEVGRTGKAASYPIVMFEDGLGSDAEHAVSGSGTHTVSVTNIYDSTVPDDKLMTVQKIWKDQDGNPLVIHPDEVTAKIYRMKLPGTASSSGEIVFNSVGGPYEVIGQPTTWQDNNNQILNDVVFYYNGHYYYVRAGQSVFSRAQLQQWVAQLDRGEMDGDHTTRLTGNVWTLEEVKEKARNNEQIQRGDLCLYNGKYWVFRHTGGAFGSAGHTWGPDTDGNWSEVGAGNILTGVTIDLMPNSQYLTEETIRNQTIPELYEEIDRQLAESGTGITWSDGDKALELYRDNVVITEDMDWETVFRVDTGYLYFVFEDPIPGYTTTYGYEEYGVYDQEHSIEIINTTTRGELDVTKTWAGENTADRIYFIVQQNETDDITVDIAETPANYGLTVEDVFAQEAGNYLILKKGDSGWNTLRIRNLMLADYKPNPVNDVPYVYTVKEIGYHDADGDHWNTANILSGYSMSEQGREETRTAAGAEVSGGVGLGITVSTITIHNETPTGFSFTKAWKKNGAIQPWPEPAAIQVALNAYTDAENPDTKALEDSTYTLSSDSHEGWAVTENEDGTVTFTIDNLKAFDDNGNALTYYVKETAINGYTTSYAAADGQAVENGDRALNGQQIINTEYINIRVIKQKAGTTERMTGAEFRLDRKNSEGVFAAEQAAAPVNENGELLFEGLPDGEYRIAETKAPAGYMPIASPIQFTISNGEVNYSGSSLLVTYTEAADDTPATFTVDNQPGVALPSTGGEGTAPYIVTGIALMALAGIFLLDRKRKDQK